MADGDAAAKKSDLRVRTVSAIVMLAVAGVALWLGGYAWWAVVLLAAAGVFYEWRALVRGFVPVGLARILWNLAGILYIGCAAAMLLFLREPPWGGVGSVILLLGAVIATDIGAYFTGRTIGGPKIAPRISPSKTWSGLIGGMAGAGVAWFAITAAISQFYATSLCTHYDDLLDRGGPYQIAFDDRCAMSSLPIDLTLVWKSLLIGAVIAIVAQSGDFFESWLKRKAGVKDSSHLIPGHGGVFDRVDGLLAVSFVVGLVGLMTAGMGR